MGSAHHFVVLNNWLLESGFLSLKRTPWTALKRALFGAGITLRNVHRVANRLGLARHAEYKGLYSTDWLLKLAFLSFNDVDWSRSVAYSFGRHYGPIYLNVRGREPQGIVEPGAAYDRVREQGHPIVGVNYGAASTTKGKPNEQQFANLGAELWWTVRRKLLGEVGAGDPIILDPEVAKDIEGDCVGREWVTTSDGKIKLESKEDMLARGLKSPDYGDALTLSYAPIRLTPRVKFPKRKTSGSPWARGGRRTFARAEM